MRFLGLEIQESTVSGYPSMAHIAIVMLPVFAAAWLIGYALIDWFELIHLSEAQSRAGYRDVFRCLVGALVLAIPATVFSYYQTLRRQPRKERP